MKTATRMQLERAVRNVEARSVAEKMLVLAMIIGGLVLAYLSFSWDPLSADIATARQQIANVERQIEARHLAYNEMMETSQQDPNRFANERLARITAEQERMDQDIENLAGDLISPTEMTSILTSLLEQQAGLELLTIHNVAAKPLRSGVEPSAQQTASSSEESAPVSGQVYEHGLVLEFEGDFFSTLKYLRYVEQVSGSFFWDAINYQQIEWPRGRVRLEIHTLSTQEGFIGV